MDKNIEVQLHKGIAVRINEMKEIEMKVNKMKYSHT